MPLHSVNPSTGFPIRSYPELSPQEVRQRLDASARAYEDWRRENLGAEADRPHRITYKKLTRA